MADGNTTATAPTEGDGKGADTGGDKDARGSEFAFPTGVKDGEIWEKHFGKGAKEAPEKAAKKAGKDSSSGNARASERSKTSSKTSARSPKGDDQESSTPKDAPSKKDPPKAQDKAPKDPEPDSSSDSETDPEAPSKKARDLFAQAKKAEDPKEARRLYKRAMREAFGEVPEEFDDGRYAAVRRERKAAQAALDAQTAEKEGKIREAAEKVRPAIYVMRQLEAAGLGDKLTVPLVEKSITVLRALRDLESGDYTRLADVISKATGVDPDEAMKRFVRGVKVSAEGRASREAAQAAERRAAEAERRTQELERRLNERDTAQTEAAKKAERARAVQEARASYLESIEAELEDHPVLKLKDGSKRVMREILRTANKKLKAATLTFTQAADRIVRRERERVDAARAAFGEEEAPAPAPSREPQNRVVHIPRTARAETGTADTSPEATFNRIFDKHHGTGGRRR